MPFINKLLLTIRKKSLKRNTLQEDDSPLTIYIPTTDPYLDPLTPTHLSCLNPKFFSPPSPTDPIPIPSQEPTTVKTLFSSSLTTTSSNTTTALVTVSKRGRFEITTEKSAHSAPCCHLYVEKHGHSRFQFVATPSLTSLNTPESSPQSSPKQPETLSRTCMSFEQSLDNQHFHLSSWSISISVICNKFMFPICVHFTSGVNDVDHHSSHLVIIKVISHFPNHSVLTKNVPFSMVTIEIQVQSIHAPISSSMHQYTSTTTRRKNDGIEWARIQASGKEWMEHHASRFLYSSWPDRHTVHMPIRASWMHEWSKETIHDHACTMCYSNYSQLWRLTQDHTTLLWFRWAADASVQSEKKIRAMDKLSHEIGTKSWV